VLRVYHSAVASATVIFGGRCGGGASVVHFAAVARWQGVFNLTPQHTHVSKRGAVQLGRVNRSIDLAACLQCTHASHRLTYRTHARTAHPQPPPPTPPPRTHASVESPPVSAVAAMLMSKFTSDAWRAETAQHMQPCNLWLRLNSHRRTRHRQHCFVVSGGRCELGFTVPAHCLRSQAKAD